MAGTTTITIDTTPDSTTEAHTPTKPRLLLPPPRPTTGIITDIIDTTAIIGTIVTTDTIGITDITATIDIDTTTEDEYRRLFQPLPSTIRSTAASAESGLTFNL